MRPAALRPLLLVVLAGTPAQAAVQPARNAPPAVPPAAAPIVQPAPALDEPPVPAAERPVTYTLSIGGSTTFNADLDDSPGGEEGGGVSVHRAGVGFNVGIPVLERGLLRLGVDSEYSVYDFTDATGLIPGTDDPFDTVYSQSFSALLGVRQTERWGWIAGANVGVSGEAGADFGKAIVGGGLAGVRYHFNENFSLSLGVAARTRLEESALVLPLLIIDWKITDKLRLSNDNGINLTLTYRARETLDFTLDGGWESRDFRLDEDGPLPDGVARDSRAPLAVGATWRPTPSVALRARVGAYLWQEFEIDDENGDEVSEINTQPTPFASLLLTFSF